MRADRPDFGPVSSAPPTRLNNLFNLTQRSQVTATDDCVSSIRHEGTHCMSTTVAIDTWVKRLADDERMRDAIRLEADETASRRADLVRRNGRRLIDELRAVLIRDVDAFRAEFPGDRSRDVVVSASAPDGGFVVSKPERGAASLTITPNLHAATIACHFRFMLSDGLPPREDRFDVTFAADSGAPLLMRHNGTGQVFATPEVLSEFLLVPVLTGRCR